MPLYEYKCHRCGKRLEVRQHFSEAPLSVHEECGGELERLVSLPSLQFKGTGWYVTDYGRGKSSQPANGKPESNQESKESKQESKESKPESKKDAKPDTKTESTPAVTSSSK